MPEFGPTCEICGKTIPGSEHMICRRCVTANGWNPALFGYLPQTPKGREKTAPSPRTTPGKGNRR